MKSKAQRPGIEVQDRDVKILSLLLDSRLATLDHIAALHFENGYESAKKRVHKLKSQGLLAERPRRVYHPSILHLTPKGLKLLEERGSLARLPDTNFASFAKRAVVKETTIRHELEVLDTRVAFHVAARQKSRLSILEFSTWPVLFQFLARPSDGAERDLLVKPDGFIRIGEEDRDGAYEHSFFIEIDRSTETLATLATRAGCYLDYYRSGGFAVKNGMPPSSAQDAPFRVLMVFKTPERRNNMADALLRLNPPIFTHSWLSTLDEVKRDPFGPIWIRPVDYRDALKETAFDPETWKPTGEYRRQSEREATVEERAKRNNLLG